MLRKVRGFSKNKCLQKEVKNNSKETFLVIQMSFFNFL
jgi:hypothetical protein